MIVQNGKFIARIGAATPGGIFSATLAGTSQVYATYSNPSSQRPIGGATLLTANMIPVTDTSGTGTQGTTTATGATGPAGPQGATGPQGIQGVQGIQGASTRRVLKGFKGPPERREPPELTGPPLPSGPSGPPERRVPPVLRQS